MDWVILLFGVLIGWGGEWLVDLFYWRRRQAGTTVELEQANAALIAARAENQQLKAKVVELEDMPATVPVAAQQTYAVAADDLTIVEGIGDKTADLLNQNSITTFEQLANTDVHRLRGILHDGGAGFQLHDPTTWPRQARLAANRDWVKLAALKAELVGGVPQSALDLEDDLTRIEGVGPKVATLLNDRDRSRYSGWRRDQHHQPSRAVDLLPGFIHCHGYQLEVARIDTGHQRPGAVLPDRYASKSVNVRPNLSLRTCGTGAG